MPWYVKLAYSRTHLECVLTAMKYESEHKIEHFIGYLFYRYKRAGEVFDTSASIWILKVNSLCTALILDLELFSTVVNNFSCTL